MLFQLFVWLSCIPGLVSSLAPTDEITDADLPQSGYLPDHNMQPSIVGSSSFGILWTKTYNDKERWYAKPLVYTPPGQKQLVFTASSQNWIRTVDAVTGTLINARQVQPPFLQSDLGCTDMPDTIGIVGTPVIDPNTNTAYFFAKGYQNKAASGGIAKGVYNFYAVNVLDLTDRPGFPVLVDGNNADNDPERYFIGGTVLQRPSLTMIGSTVYGTFGGHCDLFNYTGMIAGVSTVQGVGVNSMFAMEAAPGAPPVTLDIMNQKGGKAGIWMSGMAPATDGGRLFVTTGNGQGHENKDTPASGRSPLSTLDEVVANFAVSDGKIALQDYFEPYEYIGMDAGDRDLGSGGVALLDPSVFKGTNGVTRIAVTIGKNGKAYIMNADNLGGFKLGPGATDNIIQTIISPNAVFGGVGSYPLEGGYIYFTPVGEPLLAYKLGLDQKGSPLFSKVGQSPENSAGRVGVGTPTVTTYKGESGTGIVWVTDVDAGLKAYKAVPDASGKLVRINIPPTGGLNKFQRPAFGDGRLYVTATSRVICMGSPVSFPLNCTGPVNFGDVTIGTTKTVQVQCQALIPITKINGLTTGDKTYQASNASLPQGALNKGDTFSFPVTWNLTEAAIQDTPGSSFGAVSPGVKTSFLVITTTNGVAQYSNSLPITLQGNEVSSAAFLSLSPPEVDFGGIVVGSPGAATGLDSSFIISNIGSSPLKITGYGWSGADMDDGQDGSAYTNVTQTKEGSIIGDDFTSSNLPAVGSIIAAGKSLTVPINFNSDEVGNYQSVFNIWTNGGSKYVLLTGSATTSPIAKLATETSEGGWDTSGSMDFGNVRAGTTVTRRLRICNEGGSPLQITKSKPPVRPELRAENPTSDLHEGQSIAAGECAYAPIDIAAAPTTPNIASHDVTDVWVLNTDDLTFGVHEVEIKATIVSRQLGPTYANGTSRYTYLGCYSDLAPRQLEKLYDLNTLNENGVCQEKCQGLGYRFAGTEYRRQCWCGNLPPNGTKYTPESAKKCTFGCSADTTQACGGDGTYISIYYDSSKYTPDCKAVPCGSSSSSTTLQSSTSRSSTLSTSASGTTTSASVTTTSRTSTSTSSTSTSQTSTSQTSTSQTSTPQISTSRTSSSQASTSQTSSSQTSSSQTSFSQTLTSRTSTSTTSTLSTTGSGTSSSSSTSTSTTPSTTKISTSTSDTFSPTSTTSSSGPSSTHTDSWKPLGCYKDGPLGKTISPYTNRYATDLMTIEICLDYCQSKGTSYAGIEYRRECYCGNALASDATSNAGGCTLSCKGDANEICGGSLHMNVYQAISKADSPSTTSLSLSSPSSAVTTTSNPSSSTSTTKSKTSFTSPSSIFATTTLSTLTTTTRTPSSSSGVTYITPTPSATATPTKGFYSLGCYAEPPSPTKKPLTRLLASDTMSPDLCISALSSANNKMGATKTYDVFGLEYGRECWAGEGLVKSQTSLTGDLACNVKCKGDASISCGGRGMYNYYVATELKPSLASTSVAVRASGVVRR
ncbi:hypothetical protein XANCAGTX0491_008300 [Xanthoria calcicola]